MGPFFVKIFALDFREYIFFSRKFRENMCKTDANALKSLTDFAKIAFFSRKQKEYGDFGIFFRANKKVCMIVAKFAQNFVKIHETSRKFAFL
jgi:hypothetical protein